MRYDPTLPHPVAPTDRDQVLALFGFPGLETLSDVLPAATRRMSTHRGMMSAYPPLLQYAVAATARVYGSQHRALQELQYDDGLWAAATQAYRKVTGVRDPLPSSPPTAHQQDYFVKRLAQDPLALHALSDAFTYAAVRQARLHGNFPDTTPSDDATLDLRHAVVGAETVYRPFSKVFEQVDAVTHEVIVRHSRARHSPRIQRTHSDPAVNGPHGLGVNHVSLPTLTDVGPVVLGNIQSLAADSDPALRVIAQVDRYVGEHLGTVVWDRDLSGQAAAAVAASGGDPQNATWHGHRLQDLTDQTGHRAGIPLSLSPLTIRDAEQASPLQDLAQASVGYRCWVRARLGPRESCGRAMRLSVPAQFVDHLCAGTLANAITHWRADQLHASVSPRVG